MTPVEGIPPLARAVPKMSPAISPRIWAISVLLLLAGLAAWYRTRIPFLRLFLADQAPQSFDMTPLFLSASVDGNRPVGTYSQSQVDAFRKAGGNRPASGLDIRAFLAVGPSTVLSQVDPGICWILYAASLLGMGLSIDGVVAFQEGVDFLCFGLATWLAFRLWGPVAAGLTSLFYGANFSIPELAHYVTYYFWSVPLALALAHLTVSSVHRSRSALPWWLSLVLVAMAAIWIRVLWLPVLLMFLPVFGVIIVRRRRWLAGIACVLVLGLNYRVLLARVANEGLGDGLHPRSQLWHTLYIGLGAYGDWGSVRWSDAYAVGLAGTAGLNTSQPARYDEFFHRRFLEEVERHPVKYIASLVRRIGDYVDAGRASTAGARALSRRSWLGWAFLIVVTICLTRDRFGHVDELAVGALYGFQIAVWALLVPPQMPYPVETLGLAYPLLAGVLVVSLRAVARYVTGAPSERTQNTKR
jgi:hypothetical protein